MTTLSATYSPEDNKLRLYASSRLDQETYERVKAAGFKWAAKQDLFVAPMWTPSREDLLIELAGEIGDEDTSLVDRAEERAERFEGYQDKRANEAERARDAVAAIADNIPFGQPILIGHHSQARAERDAKRIENGMRKALKLWDTSQYWEARAKGALRHAKYKELPKVRNNRIKTIEADIRKCEKENAESTKQLGVWLKIEAIEDSAMQKKMAARFAGMIYLYLPAKGGDADMQSRPSAYSVLCDEPYKCYAPRTVAEVIEHAKEHYPRLIAHNDRWIAHSKNRIAYERAMLGEQIGCEDPGKRYAYTVGAQILISHFGGTWATITRVNKGPGGGAVSLTVAPIPGVRSRAPKVDPIAVLDYREPDAETIKAAKAATKLPPLCNYPGEGFKQMTKAEYDAVHKSSDFPAIERVKETATTGAHRRRRVWGAGLRDTPVFITDAKRVDPPAKTPKPEPEAEETITAPAIEPDQVNQGAEESAPTATAEVILFPHVPVTEEAAPISCMFDSTVPENDFEAMRASLKAGLKTVSAPQLFPTPPELAARMVVLADFEQDDDALEPHGGTGRIIHAIKHGTKGKGVNLTAVEIKPHLADIARGAYQVPTHCADFLQCDVARLGKFNKILMNSPFENAADITHIMHARQFLKPGGRIVAICANGPRQQAKLKPLASYWEELPPGTFKESGTMVNTVLLTIEA